MSAEISLFSADFAALKSWVFSAFQRRPSAPERFSDSADNFGSELITANCPSGFNMCW